MSKLFTHNRIKTNYCFITAVFFVLSHLNILAQIPEKPNPPKLYNNFSKEFPNFLSSSEANVIEQKLEKFSRETSNQIAVVIVDDFGAYTAAEFATLLGEKWGVGKKDKDNGIVVLIKPTGGVGERELFIAVGLGLEGAIPDLATKKIRENIMQPLFAESKYYEGLDRGLEALMKLAKGEMSEKDLPVNKGGGVVAIIVIIMIILILSWIFRKNKPVVYTSGRRRIYWGGYYGGHHSSWGGSSGSSGWSGFGGGSFGGGGSGGKW